MNSRIAAPDFSDWVRGDVVTPEQLLGLYQSDFVVGFAVDNMDSDAFAHWLKNFKEPNPKAPIAPQMEQAAKWADLFGDAIAILLDAAKDDGSAKDLSALKTPFSGKAAGLEILYPTCYGVGYDDPGDNDLDALGYPKVFHCHVAGPAGGTVNFDVDASRVVVFTGLKTLRTWRGICIMSRSLDDAIDYRKWRATYGVRAGDVAAPTYHLDKPTPGATWPPAEKTSVDTAFGEKKAALTTGGVTMNPISAPLSVGELDTTSIGLLNAIAKDLGIQLNDIFDNQGNAEKVAPDSNQTAYIQALMDRQKKHTEAMTKVLEAFGMTFEGWNSPWEEPFAQQLANIQILANIHNSSMDPETRAIAKAMLVTTYGEKIDYTKYLAEQRANVDREQRQLDAFTSGGGDKGNGSAGASNGSASKGKRAAKSKPDGE